MASWVAIRLAVSYAPQPDSIDDAQNLDDQIACKA